MLFNPVMAVIFPCFIKSCLLPETLPSLLKHLFSLHHMHRPEDEKIPDEKKRKPCLVFWSCDECVFDAK